MATALHHDDEQVAIEVQQLEGVDSQELIAELLLAQECSVSSLEGIEEKADESSDEVEHRGHRSVSVASDASEEGGRDSGIEAEREVDMVVPDQDLIDRIVTQVEIYFSDASVLKDKFLLKHIRRNKEGYVSLKLVSSFKKIKQLTKDWRVVAHALSKNSTEIQVNDLGTKIRRSTPLPEIDDTPVTCTILALNLPMEKPSIDTVSQLFASCGDIALIRVLKPGATLTSEMKTLVAKYPVMNTANCAWVEFEVTDAVKEACKLSTDEGMTVVPIVPEKITDKQTQQQKSKPNSRKNSNASQRGGQNSRKNSFNKFNNSNSSNNNKVNNINDGSKNYPMRRKAISLPYNQRPNLRDLSVIVEGRRRPKSKSCVEFPGQGCSPQQQSWMQRHLLAAAAASAASAAGTAIPSRTGAIPRPRVSLGSLQQEGVVRLPKGPDGSKGFGGRRLSELMSAGIVNERTA